MAELRVGERIGRYQLIEQIGQGGITAVYLATDTALQRQVAIKVLHAHLAREVEFRQRFRREVDALARLAHPNIVQIYSFDQADELIYLVQEFMDGGTLADAIRRADAQGNVIDFNYGLQIILQVASGLSYAHKQDVIHRDIKPNNILLSSSGRAAISDFGIALFLGQSSLTGIGTILGTPLYMAPEQVRAETVDARTDIYQLGAVLFEVLTGKRPFPGGSTPVLMMNIIQEPPPLPTQLNPEITPALQAVVLKALAKKPDERFQTMTEFHAALDAASRNLPLPFLPDKGTDDEEEERGVITKIKKGASALIDRFSKRETPPVRPPVDKTEVFQTPAGPGKLAPHEMDASIDFATTEILPHDVGSFPLTSPLAEEAGIAWLLALSGPYRGRQYQIKEAVTIGRSSFELTEDDRLVSRNHAQIKLENGHFYIEDLNSSNGTFVNSVQLSPRIPQQLQDRDEIRIGRTVMIFIQAVRPEDATGEAKQRLKEFDDTWDQLIQSLQS